jgi:hypothetical protein
MFFVNLLLDFYFLFIWHRKCRPFPVNQLSLEMQVKKETWLKCKNVKMFYVILLLASFSFGIEKCRLFPGNQFYVEMQVKKEDVGDYFWAARAQTQCMPCFTACF